MHSVEFSGPAPSLDAVCAEITAITSLPVVIIEQRSDGVYEWRARIAFACAPRDSLEIDAYRAGAIDRSMEEIAGDAELATLLKQHTVGANLPPHTHAVCCRTLLGAEPTFPLAVSFALDRLSGKVSTPEEDELFAEYLGPLTPEILAQRQRRASHKAMKDLCILALLSPLIAVGVAFRLLTLPWRMWRILQSLPKQSA